MATRNAGAGWGLRASSLGTLLVVALLAGCQPQATPLPPPNLDGPQVLVAPKPVAAAVPKATPHQPKATPRRSPNVPEEWLPSAPANAWRWIVIHHSATPAGGAHSFDRMHRQKGWDEMGYHFVVGNGTGSKDGQIEVGSRWPKQKWGAHAKTANNQYNDFGIGICLVGNFEIDRPTAAQMRSLVRLTAYLMRTYHIPASRVLGHGQTKHTDCPGRNLSVAEVRRQAGQLADLGEGDASLARREGEALSEEAGSGRAD